MTPETLLAHHDNGTWWPDDASSAAHGDMARAYATALAVMALRQARGERLAGFKIGATNRAGWARAGLDGPIWGAMWDTTVSYCDGAADVDLGGLSLPRMEPEIVFGLRATPPAEPTPQQLFDAMAWIAPGFEIVRTHRRNWTFTPAETVADGAVHARLIVGRRTPLQSLAPDAPALNALLATSRVRLMRGDDVMSEGLGAIVLDGPLLALGHFLRALRGTPGASDLQPGDIVSSGTWTDAAQIAPGQVWRADFDAPLASLQVTLR